ncbi:cistern family PEP-CTERM protein [Nostoc sp. UHCC 0251]|uniref:cistern family PEP-CTERM protein n=1 Tax=Nostoc sp. UHCC 0251 TaxID=3110240 RepID=UPI002B214267|nr:cistern family PEP-CTERM protein [Nostoc sp. UHCC 0251]MEA5625391.1 cistern family PEP-CTERM protein [Nostoc sp. UHCC 0251]
MAVVPSASAFSFSPNNDSVTVTATDINQSFEINFGGNVDTTNVEGLSSKAIFKFLGFTTVGSKTEAKFDISLSNTSSNGITSRTSALGFDVDKTLFGVGNTNGSGNTRVSGLFSNDREGSFPNQFGNVDVCFTNGNTCQGGGNGGVSTGSVAATFSPILAFNGSVTSFTLSNLGVRYQSITGTSLGTSGTGEGFYVAPPPPPKKVSEPTTAAAIALFAVSALVVKKKKHLLPA